MVFSSTVFIFAFLPITLLGYYLLKGRIKNYWLLVMSLGFFGWSQPRYLWVIILNIAINYCGAMLLAKWQRWRKQILAGTVVANLVILFYFKYYMFTVNSINELLGQSFAVKNVILPIGISFFTFQGMSYVIDVYREDVEVQKNPFSLALYITLFPQLIAGPIVRYKDIVIDATKRVVKFDDLYEGIRRFIIGLAKKVIIANTLAVTVDSVWSSGANANTWSVAWLASIAYTLQIYFDFAGYSDMAIGLGRMFGFHFNENFNLPYISKNITEFWRRWHISLSSWFRDYVYIPLGGNRKHVYLNLAIVFLLTGIWHGAAWNFIAWGIWNGIFILVERYIKAKKGTNENESAVAKVFSKIYTLFIVNMGWVLFRAPDMKSAFDYMLSMFGICDKSKVGFTLFWYLDRWTVLILILGIFFASSLPTKIKNIIVEKAGSKVVIISNVTLLIMFFLVLMRVVSGTYNPFIYFQF